MFFHVYNLIYIIIGCAQKTNRKRIGRLWNPIK
jgi:hypothetical protein